ncbi:uncharacterized protein V1518DRAFT_422470 [Limtongia smithiae]|uniref:uncharacterized protein n=1 Tax=Limtongia smithiae TaxID=1125753 RepID=UPI0034CD2EF9
MTTSPRNSRTRPKTTSRRRATRNSTLRPFCDVLKLGAAIRASKHHTDAVGCMSVSVLGLDDEYQSKLYSTSHTVKGDNGKDSTKDPKRGIKQTGLTPINAFIGFRAYYSRTLPRMHQHKLSSILSRAWASYKDKDFWTRHTVLYCAEPRECRFVDWLLKSVTPPDLSTEFTAQLASISPTMPVPPQDMSENALPSSNASINMYEAYFSSQPFEFLFDYSDFRWHGISAEGTLDIMNFSSIFSDEDNSVGLELPDLPQFLDNFDQSVDLNELIMEQ